MNTQLPLTSSVGLQQETGARQPYPPSALDRFMDFIEQLPIPYALTYLGLFIVQGTLNHVLSWMDGWVPPFTFTPLVLLFPLWLWGPLCIVTYLNSLSGDALSDFSPLLDVPPEEMRRLEYEFRTMPAKSVFLSALVWGSVYILFVFIGFEAVYTPYRVGMPLALLLTLEGLVSYLFGSIIYYHSLRQLRMVERTVNRVKQFDMFRLDPVYAFSVLTSRTGVAWVILLSLTLLMFPVQLAPVPSLALLLVQGVLALAAFVLPLRIVNQRLVAEKRRLLAEHDQRLEATLARLHRQIGEDELRGMVELNSAISGLNAERTVLEKIPTWPWRAGLLTGFLSIVVLPVILFLIQIALGRWFGN